ncbi:YqaA family protein [Avibacterium endocarditidis]|uniref:YqaA family protein n=1 Tax=Avibacterium TaxID=292486 RepID=UPI0039EF407D
MKIFGTLYDKVMQWSTHRYATGWLMFTSFIESIFFPVPTDVMLIPMAISQPKRAVRFGVYAGVASPIGGIVGYALGYYAFDSIQHYLVSLGYQAQFDTLLSWFQRWGVMVMFLAGFTPLPYKLFTICAGVMHMAFVPFLLISLVSRLARFILVAKLSAWGGQKFAHRLRQSIEWIGWAVVLLAVIIYFIFK